MLKTVKKVCFLLMAAAVLVMSACSSVAIPYKYYFTKNGSFTTGATEKLVYSVTENDDYSYGVYKFTKSSDKTVNSTHNGTYTVTLTAISESSLTETAKAALGQSKKLGGTTAFYKLATELDVAVTYTFTDSKVFTFNDKVTSEAYFAGCDFQLAPLYSSKNYDTTVLTESEIVYRFKYSTSVFYAGGKAQITVADHTDQITENPYPEDQRYIVRQTETQDRTVNYTELSAIDNEELILAGRALNYSTTSSWNLTEVDTTYLAAKTVNVKCAGASEAIITNTAENPFNFTSNGEIVTIGNSAYSDGIINVQCNTVLFTLDDNHFTGMPFICYYQKIDYVPGNISRTFPVKMYSSLAFSNGALEYELRSITVTD